LWLALAVPSAHLELKHRAFVFAIIPHESKFADTLPLRAAATTSRAWVPGLVPLALEKAIATTVGFSAGALRFVGLPGFSDGATAMPRANSATN